VHTLKMLHMGGPTGITGEALPHLRGVNRLVLDDSSPGAIAAARAAPWLWERLKWYKNEFSGEPPDPRFVSVHAWGWRHSRTVL
jgi:hypothetical protein